MAGFTSRYLKRKPRAGRGFQGVTIRRNVQGKSALDAPIRRGLRRRAAAIVFSYDHGHMFCALDDVFAKFVTAVTGSG